MSATAALEPLLEGALPDPYVVREEGAWHIFGTGRHCYSGPTLARGAMRRSELALDLGLETARVEEIWSFTPYGECAYATLHYGRFRTVIAHFLPGRGETRTGAAIRSWRLNRVVLGSDEEPTCYDARPFTGEDGALYLMYSASPARHRDVHILVQRMLDPATPDPSFRPRTLLRPEGYRSEDRNPGYIQIVEGASIAKVGDKYVLLYSTGDFARNNYKLGVAYSEELMGSYRKPLLADPRNTWRNSSKREEVCYLLQSEHKGWPNYCGQAVCGPGLGSLVKVGDGYRIVFHGYRPADRRRKPSDRFVWMLPVAVDPRESRPLSQWLRPVLPRAQALDGAGLAGACYDTCQ